MASSSRGQSGGESVVDFVGRHTSSCGYCRSGANTSITHGLWAHSLTVGDYQDLLDRGWRRSGSYLYKPEMEKTCCPLYTIRLKAADFDPSKEQLRVSKRMQRFLDGTLEKPNEHNSNLNEPSSSRVNKYIENKHGEKNKADPVLGLLSDKIDNVVQASIGSHDFFSDLQIPKASVKKVLPGKTKIKVQETKNLLYTSNIAFQLAAVLRRGQVTHTEFSPNNIAEKLTSSLTQTEHDLGLIIKACNGHINFFSEDKMIPSSEKNHLNSKDTDCNLKKNLENSQVTRRRFETRLKRSSFDPEEYALYKKYQIKVHNDKPDKVTEMSYKRFLIDSPLVFVPHNGDGTVPPCGFGSFHQQYLIDGKLIAVGVIDILPKCLSSTYLFWDPDFAFLSLGKFSALKEIEWVKENEVHCSSLQYYYLGYYIHSCIKMRYKAAYHPSELLCPLRYQWVPFKIAKPLLDRSRYVVLSDYALLQNQELSPQYTSENVLESQHNDFAQDSNDVFMDVDDEEIDEPDPDSSDDESSLGPISSNGAENGDVSNILVGLQDTHFKYKDVRGAFSEAQRSYLEPQLFKYQKVVGPKLSERIIYKLD